MSKKPTTTQLSILREFLDQADDGVMAVSDWTTGSGNYINRRATPIGCDVLEVSNLDRHYIGDLERRSIDAFIQDRPRVRKVIVCFYPEILNDYYDGEKLKGWIAIYNNKILEIKLDTDAKDLWDAKKFAIEKLKIPKSKHGQVAIEPAY
jgi:hypothetical protein